MRKFLVLTIPAFLALVGLNAQAKPKKRSPSHEHLTAKPAIVQPASIQAVPVAPVVPVKTEAPAVQANPADSVAPASKSTTPVPVAVSQTSAWANSTNWASRFSLGFEIGGGANISAPINQGWVEGNISLGFHFYDSCGLNAKGTCLRFYVLLPQIGAGGYLDSKIPFGQLSVGAGLEVGNKSVTWFLQSGIGGKFSSIGTIDEQDQKIGDKAVFLNRDPSNANLLYGWVQSGISLNLGTLATAKGVHFQISVKLGNAPARVGFSASTADLGIFAGIRWYPAAKKM